MSSHLIEEIESLVKDDGDLNEKFKDMRIVGIGAQGAVVKATYCSGLGKAPGATFALKLVKRSRLINDDGERLRKQVEREVINNTTLLLHPHIATYNAAFFTTHFLVLMMEYVNCPFAEEEVVSLESLLCDSSGMGPNLARRYFQQLVLAVEYSHRRGVANRDLKLEHCLLWGPFGENANEKYGELKICDWGLSKGDYSLPPMSRVGTPGYWAPEVVIAEREGEPYNAMAADCFSVGVILYNLLFGKRMFPPVSDVEGDRYLLDNWQELYKTVKWRKENGAPLCWQNLPQEISQECFEVLRGLLQPEVENRWTMQDVIDSKWFQKDLPALAVDLNEKALRTPVPKIEEIRKAIKNLVVAASTPAAQLPPESPVFSSSQSVSDVVFAESESAMV